MSEIGSGLPLVATLSAAVYQTTSDGAGAFELALTTGTYDLVISAAGYRSKTLRNLSLVKGQILELSLVLLPVCDSALSNWQGSWTQLGPQHWSDSPKSEYAANTDALLEFTDLDLSNCSGAWLNYDERYDIDGLGQDAGILEYRRSGQGPWLPLRRVAGSEPDWHRVSLSLYDLLGAEDLSLRFRLHGDAQFQAGGWSLSKLALTRASEDCVLALMYPAWPNTVDMSNLVAVINGTF